MSVVVVLYKLLFKKRALRNVNESEQILFFMAGQIGNDVTILMKHLLFLSNAENPPGPKRDAQIAVYVSYIRLIAGKVYEGWTVLQQLYAPYRQYYDQNIPETTLDARKLLNKAVGGGGILEAIRNKVGFHYDVETARRAIALVADDEEFVEYMGIHASNSIYRSADAIAMRSLLVLRPAEKDPFVAINSLTDEVTSLASGLTALTDAIIGTFAARNLKSSVGKMRNNRITVAAPNLNDIELPFFCELPKPHDRLSSD